MVELYKHAGIFRNTRHILRTSIFSLREPALILLVDKSNENQSKPM